MLEVLEPHTTVNGGPLVVRHVSFVEGRGNIIVEYPGQPGAGVVSLVGAHLVCSIMCDPAVIHGLDVPLWLFCAVVVLHANVLRQGPVHLPCAMISTLPAHAS